MGTRHLIQVRIDGQIKISQYGQWDGYPTGQGAEIAEFLHGTMDRPKFEAALRATRFFNEQEAVEMNRKLDADPNWKQNFPWLCRDAGAKILNLVQDSGGLQLDECDGNVHGLEYIYLIDMDDDTVNCNSTEAIPFAEWTLERMKILELQHV